MKYHVPTRFGFSLKASGFYPFGDATALAGEGGVGGVVWLIQASAWNQTCHTTNDKCEALASLKGCFLCFCFSPPVFFHWTALTFVCKWGGMGRFWVEFWVGGGEWGRALLDFCLKGAYWGWNGGQTNCFLPERLRFEKKSFSFESFCVLNFVIRAKVLTFMRCF